MCRHMLALPQPFHSEDRRIRVQGYPLLHSELGANLCYMRQHLRKPEFLKEKKSRLEEVEVQRALGLKTEEGHSEEGVERARSHRDKMILRGKEQSLGQQL